MRRAAALAFVVAMAVAPRVAVAQDAAVRRTPSVGYLYPSGAQRGTIVHVTAGGQFLNGASAGFASGDGLTITAVRAVPPMNSDQRQELRRRINEIRQTRRDGAAGRGGGRRAAKADGDEKPVELPDYFVLQGLEKTSDKGLEELLARFIGLDGKRQMNAQLADVVEFDVEVDPRATPGEREIRFQTALGLTNPMRFEVGAAPEVCEQDAAQWKNEPMPPLATPIVVDGQIGPGDVDRFRFRASRGQRLVFTTQARGLVPFLADAVPGWFQAVLTLTDARGREVACSDSFRFDPDPVLLYEVPTEGEYVLSIRDALFRGREDFVYRVTIGEQPFITRMFPLGGREGVAVEASIDGWNLLRTRLTLDTRPGGDAVRFAAVQRDGRPSNRVPYRVDRLPEIDESAAGGASHVQTVELPLVIDGRIDRAGDVHVFRFDGKAGDEIVADVEARRLASPMDSALRLVDAAGNVVAWNDDFDDGAPGVQTHHADSHVAAKLPADGRYEVRLADAEGHGGPEYAYRLRIGPPRPDFDLIVTPSTINAPAGRAVPFMVTAVRKDGFDGAIDVAFADTSSGFVIDGARIPAGKKSARMTITAPFDSAQGPIVLRLEGRARIAGEDVHRAAIPADDRMQAFAYRHLVPAQEWMALVTGPRRRMPPVASAVAAPVRVPAGGTARVVITAPGLPAASTLKLVLDDAAAGVVVEGWNSVPGGLEIVFGASPAGKSGTADNAVIELVGEAPAPREKGKEPARPRTYSLGWLPAIPYEIVAR
jgi:hypothetical protein